MDDVRWIGREGEKRFSLLCSRRMVTCNKADEDDRGWDFLVNFPPPATVRIPIDQRSTGCAALVQIKATRVDAQRWSISLKNALSLANSPLPAFIVCVGLDAEGGETFRAVRAPAHERRISAGCIELIIRPKGRITAKSSLDHEEITTLANIAAYSLLRQARRNNPLAVSLKTDGSFVDFGHINMRVDGAPGWEQLFFITDALRRLVIFENAQPVETSVNSIDAQFVPLAVLDALVASRPLRIDFTPIDEIEGTVSAFLAYTSVAFGGIEIGAVASRPVVDDRMIGSRRSIEFGPATILHASVDDGCAKDLYERYLDELDRMSELQDVLAVGDLQHSVSRDDDRILVVDAPRRTPLRKLKRMDA